MFWLGSGYRQVLTGCETKCYKTQMGSETRKNPFNFCKKTGFPGPSTRRKQRLSDRNDSASPEILGNPPIPAFAPSSAFLWRGAVPPGGRPEAQKRDGEKAYGGFDRHWRVSTRRPNGSPVRERPPRRGMDILRKKDSDLERFAHWFPPKMAGGSPWTAAHSTAGRVLRWRSSI